MTNKKQFGVWMDTHHAAIVGNDGSESGALVVIAHVNGEEVSPNSSEKNTNNHEKMLASKFFKEITTHLLNATEIHVTGTGKMQERFIHYLAETPQFKNTRAEDSTSNKMSDEKLVEFFSGKFK